MKRKLIAQICNEWRSNLWMVIELTIVGVVLWGIFSVFASLLILHKTPEGINFDRVYVGHIGYISQSASTYKPYADSLHNYGTDLKMLEAKLSDNPYVESHGTGNNAIPYNYNYSGTVYWCTIADTIQAYSANQRNMSPGMIRTLQITGQNGETPEELARLVEDGKLLLSTAERLFDYTTPEKWMGKQICTAGDSTNMYEVGAIINPIRRTDYEPVVGGGVVIYSRPYGKGLPFEMAFKVKEGKEREFVESLKADMLESGNVYVYDVRSIETLKNDAHKSISVLFRNLTACALFLMVAVFLGFLGAFWYRTQQRVPEIALRKVNGADNSNIFRRFIGEGFILLSVSAIPIAALSLLILSQLDLQDAWMPLPVSLFWSMIAVAIVALALIISIGIAIPARKAMKVNPAEALKEQ